MDIRFELGNSLMICGPSKSGKTSWVLKLIECRSLLFKDEINKLYWYYTIWQPAYEKLRTLGVILKNDISEDGLEDNIEPQSMIVLDDLVKETENSCAVTALFTRLVHHKNLFLIYITQNFYHQSREARMRHLNSHYIVFFKNPRDKTQLSILARQMFPGRSVREFVIMFEEVTKRAHGYLLIDLRQDTSAEVRLRTNIFPDEYPPLVYK